MKKLLAVFVSVLLLFTMIPFAAVSAANEPTIVLSVVDGVEKVNAGDEFQVQVNLEGLDSTAGLIGARVEIGFDPDVFELVTYCDEDEEMWIPQIEVGSKYNALSLKYITFAPIDEDTGVSERCLVQYIRATATANQVRKESHFFTATFRVKDYAVSGTYDLFVKDYKSGDFIEYGNATVEMAIMNTSIVVDGAEPERKEILDQEEVLHSVMDTEKGNGLAFRFHVNVEGMGVVLGTTNAADYSNATVRYNGEIYRLVGMGAVVTNKAIVGENESSMTLGNVNNATVLNIPAVYLCDLEPDSCAFAVRIINIPDVDLSSIIYARPDYIIEVDGMQITLYGDIDTASCAEHM